MSCSILKIFFVFPEEKQMTIRKIISASSNEGQKFEEGVGSSL